MNDARHLAARVRALARALALSDWELQVVPQANTRLDGEDLAGCTAQPEYKRARIYFDLGRIPPEELDQFIIHELMHCHVWELVNLAERLAATPTEREAIRCAEERLTTVLERLFAGRLA